MTELEKFELINKTKTPEDLKSAIEEISDEIDGLKVIPGRRRLFTVKQQQEAVDNILNGKPANLCTRNYGIRQQVLYLKYCGYEGSNKTL